MAAPKGLGERGAALWKSLDVKAGTAAGALALEACRAADRLDELDRVIQGKGVLDLMRFRLEVDDVIEDPRATVKVSFDSVLGEARQQQGNLRQMLVSLAAMKDPSAAAPAKPEPAAPASAVDEFTSRRRRRESA